MNINNLNAISLFLFFDTMKYAKTFRILDGTLSHKFLAKTVLGILRFSSILLSNFSMKIQKHTYLSLALPCIAFSIITLKNAIHN